LIKRTAVFSGFGLLERTEHQYPDMPVVMVTGVHDVSVALSAIRNGAFDYLMKPFEREQLVAVVRRALDDRRMKLERRAYVSRLESQVATLTEQLRGRTS
jgi:FixJ family two-component response regulator